jgi:pyruvate-formate lyase-activating enzyme
MEASEPRPPLEAQAPERAAPALLEPAEPWWRDALMITFSFRCNYACTFCMVEDVLGVLPGTSLERFTEVAREGLATQGVRRVVLSGGEVTLSPELAAFARVARSIPGVEHVRVQTNASRLADRALLGQLIDAGVDELFVSLHGATAATCDALTRRPGSFDEIVRGLEAIAASGARLSTNTCVVSGNVAELPAIVELAARFSPVGVELWNYWPRGDEEGARELAAPVAEVRPQLVRAIEAALAHGVAPVVKWFPRCLLGPLARYQDDGQPRALLDDAYWAREPHYACLYEGVCEDAGTRCSGLSFPYVERYGWEDELLVPRRGVAAVGPNGESVLSRSLVKDGAQRGEAARAAAFVAPLGARSGRARARLRARQGGARPRRRAHGRARVRARRQERVLPAAPARLDP